MGLTGALVTGKLSRTVRDRKFASTLPAQGAVGEVSDRSRPHQSAERPKDTSFCSIPSVHAEYIYREAMAECVWRISRYIMIDQINQINGWSSALHKIPPIRRRKHGCRSDTRNNSQRMFRRAQMHEIHRCTDAHV